MMHSAEEGGSSTGVEGGQQNGGASQRRRRSPLVPQSRTASLPLSFAQERLWFLHQLGTVGAAYNMPGAFRLEGDLNVAAFERSIADLILRHESLRTRFLSVDGSPIQVIDATTQFSLDFVDLSGLEESERLEQAQRLAAEAAQKPFDLEQGSLLRTSLLKLGDREHMLLMTLHHIISDGWSNGILCQELAELYGAYSQGAVPALAPLPIQPVDHAIWQREWLSDARLEEQLSYWRAQLQGLATLELPTDRPRPAMSSFRGSKVEFSISEELFTKLKALCKANGVTPYMVFLAAFQVLLARYTGQEDITVGSPIAGRTREELDGLIGFFVNTLVLRTDLSGNPTFLQLLARVKATARGAYEHQELPFEKIVQELRPTRNLSQQPMFQVMFGLHNFPRQPYELSGLKWTTIESEHKTAIFDLSLHLFEEPGGISALYEYATDLFDRRTVESMASHLLKLLESIVARPDCGIRHMPILPEAERRQLLEHFNRTQTDFPREKLIHELFEEQVARTPDAVAVIYEGRSLTYAEVNVKANQLARHLRALGVGPDQVVGVCLQRGLEMLIAVVGTLKAGGAYLPLDPGYPAERLRYMLDDAAPSVVLMHAATRDRLPAGPMQLVALDSVSQELASLDGTNLPQGETGVSAEHLVFLIYTSGSTGQPKGTAMPHRSMVNLIEWHRSSFGSAVGMRVLQFAALSFDASFHEIFSTLSTGGTLVLLDEWVRRDARALTHLMRAQQVARLFIPPLMLQTLAEHCVSTGDVPEALRDVIAAGEQLRITAEMVSFFRQLPGCRLHNDYGPTETHVVTSLTLSGDPERWPVLPSIGRPIANTRIYVLDEERQLVPVGVRGEIYIGGVAVARGYLGRADLTAQRFVTDPFSTDPQARLYKTGDVGRWCADGTIEFLGRNDDQVKIRGYRIEPGEIEAQLARHPQVADVAVTAREVTAVGKSLVAYLIPRDGQKLIPEELRTHLMGVLPEYMVPSAFVLMDRFPLTPVGKLDRRALPAPEQDAYASRGYEAPRGEIEEILAGIWQELLGVERVGRNDNFFELGGHSLRGVRLVSRLSKSLGLDVSVGAIFVHSTIQQLANFMETLTLAAKKSVQESAEIEEGEIT